MDGDVTAELVYVNYGVPADYENRARGVNVAGKIVISRYGGSWRASSRRSPPNTARSAASSTRPVGRRLPGGDVYPVGGYRNEFSRQRGSVADTPVHPGTRSRPSRGRSRGEAARHQGRQNPHENSDASDFVQRRPAAAASLGGQVVPDGWKGGLPLTYHIGPGPAKVRLAVAFNWDIVPIHNVVARLRGSERPDEWIIRGNHHDGWVNGAFDPVSGLVAMMAEARSLGAMVKEGWKPKRTIVYCAWDAEEPGLLGSTEWAEAHAAELRRKAALYINTDATGRGSSTPGSHTLEKFFNAVVADVADPQYGISVGTGPGRPGSSFRPARTALRYRAGATCRSTRSDRDRIHAVPPAPGVASLNIAWRRGPVRPVPFRVRFLRLHRFADTDFSYGVAPRRRVAGA